MQQARLTYSDIGDKCKMLECTAAEMETDTDKEMITDFVAPLRAKIVLVKETVEYKETVSEIVTEHVRTRTAAKERICNLRERLKDDTLSVCEMEELRSDLGRTRDELLQLESHNLEMEAQMTAAGLVLKDREMGDVVDVKADTEKLLSEVEKDDKKLKVCADMAAVSARLCETDGKLNELTVVYADDVDSVASSLQVLSLFIVCLIHISVLLLWSFIIAAISMAT